VPGHAEQAGPAVLQLLTNSRRECARGRPVRHSTDERLPHGPRLRPPHLRPLRTLVAERQRGKPESGPAVLRQIGQRADLATNGAESGQRTATTGLRPRYYDGLPDGRRWSPVSMLRAKIRAQIPKERQPSCRDEPPMRGERPPKIASTAGMGRLQSRSPWTGKACRAILAEGSVSLPPRMNARAIAGRLEHLRAEIGPNGAARGVGETRSVAEAQPTAGSSRRSIERGRSGCVAPGPRIR